MQQQMIESKHIFRNGTKSNKFRVFRDNLELSVLALPAVLYFFIWSYLPMAGLVIAFKDYRYDKGIFGSDWIGLANFKFFFTSQDLWRITRNTVCYASVFIIIEIISAAAIALLMFELKRKFVNIYQTIIILPRFMSWVIVGYISYAFLNPVQGFFNQILLNIGLEPTQWYSKLQYWPFILVLIDSWKVVGINSIMYFASLMGINTELFEAAMIDGAGKWKQVKHISIPSLVPLMIILGILAVGGLFRGDFGLFYQIPRNVGILYPVTDIIDTYVFRGLWNGNYAMSAAVGLFQSLMGLLLVIFTNFIVKLIDSEKSLF
jgi:ABC-type polysaccharide transport system, permease component